MSEYDDLESRLAWQEDAIAKLSSEVAMQNMTIDKLQRQLQHLLRELKHLRDGKGDTAAFNPANEIPPHY